MHKYEVSVVRKKYSEEKEELEYSGSQEVFNQIKDDLDIGALARFLNPEKE